MSLVFYCLMYILKRNIIRFKIIHKNTKQNNRIVSTKYSINKQKNNPKYNHVYNNDLSLGPFYFILFFIFYDFIIILWLAFCSFLFVQIFVIFSIHVLYDFDNIFYHFFTGSRILHCFLVTYHSSIHLYSIILSLLD